MADLPGDLHEKEPPARTPGGSSDKESIRMSTDNVPPQTGGSQDPSAPDITSSSEGHCVDGPSRTSRSRIADKYGFSKEELVDALKAKLPVAFANHPYSSVIMAALDRIPNLPGLHRSVLRVLIERLGLENRCCWPSQKTIARDAGVSRRTVQHAIALARKREWLTVKKVRVGNLLNYNEYRFFQPFISVVAPTGHSD